MRCWGTGAPVRVDVTLSAHAYQVVIGDGLIARAGPHLAAVLPQKRAVVITDQNVAALHLPELMAGLTESGFDLRQVVVAAGEASKSLGVYGQVADALLEEGVERRTAVIALGGGVVGDLAGFAAATVLRGLPFVQIPTTLLAQVDSSVGGKAGINTAFGKNLLGAFYQPRIVLADTASLATLPRRELQAGYAEILKAGLIGDPGLYAWCEVNGVALLAGDRDAQAHAVAAACAFKARVVAEDEREEHAEGGRALLNLGHTFAHALEAESGYTGALLAWRGGGAGYGAGVQAFGAAGRVPGRRGRSDCRAFTALRHGGGAGPVGPGVFRGTPDRAYAAGQEDAGRAAGLCAGTGRGGGFHEPGRAGRGGDEPASSGGVQRVGEAAGRCRQGKAGWDVPSPRRSFESSCGNSTAP